MTTYTPTGMISQAMQDDRRGSPFRAMTRAEARFMLFWDAPSPKIRHCFESLGQAICQGEIYSHFGPDHVRDRVHNRACSRLQGWQAMSAVKQPDLYFVYKAEDHVSMKLGLALAITLLKLPAVSDADRDLAVSELSGVLHRMEGQ